MLSWGVSYGTFVLMDVLADRRLTITTTIADGMPTMDYADIKNPVLQNIYLFLLTGFSYWLICQPHSGGDGACAFFRAAPLFSCA